MKKVVIVRITGGLGNQMFQYAAGLGLARHVGAELLLDISLLKLARRFRATRRRLPGMSLLKKAFYIEPHLHFDPYFSILVNCLIQYWRAILHAQSTLIMWLDDYEKF